MGILSSIKTLPPDILAELDALLLDPRVTQLDATRHINDRLAEIGEERRVSKSSVNRYALSYKEMTEELSETRRVSEMLVAELGVDNHSKVGQVTTEMTRVMVFHFSTMLRKYMIEGEMDFDEMKTVAGMLKDLAFSHERLEKSASENQKRTEADALSIKLDCVKSLKDFIKVNFPQHRAAFAAIIEPFGKSLAGGKA